MLITLKSRILQRHTPRKPGDSFNNSKSLINQILKAIYVMELGSQNMKENGKYKMRKRLIRTLKKKKKNKYL